MQLIYRTSHADGARLVADPRVGATGYTGSRSAGLMLKAAADAAGKPIYLELSSINPVVVLPGALAERADKIADEFTGSCLMGTGQFCTNPGLVLLLAGPDATRSSPRSPHRFRAAPAGTLLSAGVERSLERECRTTGPSRGRDRRRRNCPTPAAAIATPTRCYRSRASSFLPTPRSCKPRPSATPRWSSSPTTPPRRSKSSISLEGNLTGCIYSDTRGSDDELYDQLAEHLRPKVGRLLNDKMPTGVAVSPAMNHGGPYPATGHPGFTAVGIPAALRRFAMLACYDNVRPHRLPSILADKIPPARRWRLIDGAWTQGDVKVGRSAHRRASCYDVSDRVLGTRSRCKCGTSRIANGDARSRHASPRCDDVRFVDRAEPSGQSQILDPPRLQSPMIRAQVASTADRSPDGDQAHRLGLPRIGPSPSMHVMPSTMAIVWGSEALMSNTVCGMPA